MIIYDQLTNTNIYTVYVLILLTSLFFLLAGIMLLVKKDTKLISKVHKFHNPEGFAKAYGLVEVVTSTVLIGLTIYGFIDLSSAWTIIVVSLLLVIFLLLVQVFLQKKYKQK